MDQIVKFFFKHEKAVFLNGQFKFGIHPSVVLLVVIALLIAIFVYFVYIRRPYKRVGTPTLWTLMALRIALFALLVFMLLRPTIVVQSVIPRSTHVMVLVDNSLSMQLMDERDNRSRLEAIKQLFLASPKNAFPTKLEERFKIVIYEFSNTLMRTDNVQSLTGDGASTDIPMALKEAVKNSSNLPLSGIILMTDGSSNVPADLAEQIQTLQAKRIPLYAVGVGSTKSFMDVELSHVDVPRKVLTGSSIKANLIVRINGYKESKLLISVSEDGRAISTKEFNTQGGSAQSISIDLVPTVAGSKRYTFSIAPMDGETTVENNAGEALIEVYDGPVKVLYFEGEPRWEYGKIRSALTRNEKNVILVSMLRTGENKLYRQGIEGEGELGGGFPKTEEELFKYQGLVLGSVESTFFTSEQVKLIEAFASRRGGGVLFIGGRNAFDGGGYATTPIADLLPFYLDNRVDESSAGMVPNYKPNLTAQGQNHPITRLNVQPGLNQKIWNELPPIFIPDIQTATKPGAIVLLEAKRVDNNRRGSNDVVPLLAEQRYGRGRTMALVASDTWRWQMGVDSKNNAHETFWRQTLRYLTSTTPNQIEIATEQDVYALNDTVRIIADIRDEKFELIKDARATARVIKPSGVSIDVSLRFASKDESNTFAGEFIADEIGTHKLELNSGKGKQVFDTVQSSFLVTELNREFYNAQQNDELLKRIATETGGKYYQLNESNNLIDDLTYRNSENSERISKDLWDMPINFFLILCLVSAEWFMRKREGLA
jgi:uncharacterized membrane protein